MRNPLPIPFTTVNYLIGLCDSVFQTTDTSSYSQLSTTSSDCVLQTQIPLVIHNCRLLVPLLFQASSHLVPLLLQASSHLVPLLLQASSLHFLVFLLKLFYFTCSCYFFYHYQFELISCILAMLALISFLQLCEQQILV